MDTIEMAETILKPYPDLSYSVEESTITVAAPNSGGFSVSLGLDDPTEGKYVVGFGGWYMEVDHEMTALNCFAWGLTDRCRVRVEMRGSKAAVWDAESIIDNEWVSAGNKVVMIFVPYWRKRKIEYRQNSVIKDTKGIGPGYNPDECDSAVIRLLRDGGIKMPPQAITPTETKLHQLINMHSNLTNVDLNSAEIKQVANNSLAATRAAKSYCTRLQLDNKTNNQTVAHWRIDVVRPDRWSVTQTVNEPDGTVYDRWITIGSDIYINAGFWIQPNDDELGARSSNFNTSTSIDTYLDILEKSDPASVATSRSDLGEHFVFKYSPPLPNERANKWLDFFNAIQSECMCRLWVNASTFYLKRVDFRGPGLLGDDDDDGRIVQTFTCFGEDIVIDPPPALATDGSKVEEAFTVKNTAEIEHYK